MSSHPLSSDATTRRHSAAQVALAIPELVELILEHRASLLPNWRWRRDGDLARLARISKCWYRAAVPRLYKDLTFTFAGSGSQYSPAATGTTLLVKLLTSRPDFAALAGGAAVGLSAGAHLRDVLVVHRLANLRDLSVHLVGLPVTVTETSLLASLPHLESVSISFSSDIYAGRLPTDFLQRLLGKPMHDRPMDMRFVLPSWAILAAYAHFLGDRIGSLEITCVRAGPRLADWETVMSSFPSVRKLEVVSSVPGWMTERMLSILLASLTELQHLEVYPQYKAFDGAARVRTLEALADPAVLPNLRTTPGFYLETAWRPSLLTEDVPPQGAVSSEGAARLLEAAKQGLAGRPSWAAERSRRGGWS